MNSKKLVFFLNILVMLSLVGYDNIISYAASDTVSGIEVLTEPKIKEYCVGDTFQTRGMSFVVTYNSGESIILTQGYELNYDFSTAGDKVVQITYTENGSSVSTNYNVKVYEKPLLSTENKEVAQGDTFSIPVYISKNCGIMGTQIIVEYDTESFVPILIDNKDFFDTGIVEDSIGTSLENSFQVIWAGTENVSTDGKLFDITFLCKENASMDESTISIKAVSTGTYNENYSTITCVETSSVITVRSASDLHKKTLTDLMVTMKDWYYGETASVPVVTGNVGNGEITYCYASQADGMFSETMPTAIGEYILKVVVEESQEYYGGIATCTFAIKKKEEPVKTTEDKEEATTEQRREEVTTEQKKEETTENKKVVLSKPAIKSVKNVKGKKVVVKLKKKIKNASGYEIRYSTKKNMKSYKKVFLKSNSKLSKKISKLKKGKTYYFRIRAYKKVAGQTYYSKWSDKRKVKIKK